MNGKRLKYRQESRKTNIGTIFSVLAIGRKGLELSFMSSQSFIHIPIYEDKLSI